MSGDNERLRHDVAVVCAQNTFDFLYGLLSKENEDEVFVGIYARVKAALEVYDLKADGNKRQETGNN
jgi:hypothetical protein